MDAVLKEVSEIAFLVFASIIWMAAEEPASLIFAALAALGVATTFWLWLGWLGNRLPPPRTTCEWVCDFIRVLAFVMTIAGVSASFALERGNNAVEAAITNLRRECYERTAGAWQGATFRLAAARLAALGPDYAATADNALHGGLTLPVKDERAAQVIAQVYAEQAQARLRNDDRPGYRLLSYLLPRETKAGLCDITLPETATVLTAAPDPKNFVGSAINAGLLVAETAIRWEIEDYVAIRQWKLCAPALCLWMLTFIITIWTAVRRLNRQSWLLECHR